MEFTSWNPKEPYHFGVRGMRWGQRRFQNLDGSLTSLGKARYGSGGSRGSFGRSRDLNKLDRERVRAAAKSQLYREKADNRYSRKNYRFQKHNPNSGKLAKDDKVKRWESKAKSYSKLANRSKQMADRIISNSRKKGMSVRSKDTLRQVNIGRNYAKSLGVSMLVPGIYNKQTYAKGSHYRVKNDGLGQRIHKKRRSVSRYVGNHNTYVFG